MNSPNLKSKVDRNDVSKTPSGLSLVILRVAIQVTTITMMSARMSEPRENPVTIIDVSQVITRTACCN